MSGRPIRIYHGLPGSSRPQSWLALVAALALAACGGGGGGGGDDSWLFPLWVPTDVAIADIDGDGRPDILTLAQLATSNEHREGRLAVYRQRSDGSFAAPATYVVGVYPWRFRVTDVDGDGLPDLVVADVGLKNVIWMRQDPASAGHFLDPAPLLSGLNPYQVAVADFNGDGSRDVVATDSINTAQHLVLRPQDPLAPGSFLDPTDIPLPGSSTDVSTGDLDMDGLADIVVSQVSGSGLAFDSTLGVLRQQPGGTLAAMLPLVTRPGLNTNRLAVGDYDNDGRPDVLAFLTQSSSDYTTELLAVLDPLSASPTVVESSLAGISGRDDAAFADLDGDGRLDAVVVGSYPVGVPSTIESRVSILLQDGSGQLRLRSSMDPGIEASVVATGDVDGDGRTDLAVYGADDHLRLLRQSRTTPGAFDAAVALH